MSLVATESPLGWRHVGTPRYPASTAREWNPRGRANPDSGILSIRTHDLEDRMALLMKMQAYQVLRHGGKIEHTYHAGEKLDEPLIVRGVTREQITLGAVTGHQGETEAEKVD